MPESPIILAERLSRGEAEARLEAEAPGAYLVRSKGAKRLVLSVSLGRNDDGISMYIHHLLKRREDNVWTVDGNTFDSSHTEAQDFVKYLISQGSSWTEQPLLTYVGEGKAGIEVAETSEGVFV